MQIRWPTSDWAASSPWPRTSRGRDRMWAWPRFLPSQLGIPAASPLEWSPSSCDIVFSPNRTGLMRRPRLGIPGRSREKCDRRVVPSARSPPPVGADMWMISLQTDGATNENTKYSNLLRYFISPLKWLDPDWNWLFPFSSFLFIHSFALLNVEHFHRDLFK